MVSPRSEQSGLSPGPRHCVLFLGKKFNSHSASLHPGVFIGYQQIVEET